MSESPPASRRLLRWEMLVFLLLVAVGVLAAPGNAAAHNSLDGSTPKDGAVVPSAPSEIVWSFANAVPLDTLTVTLIDGTGTRTELDGSHHGSDRTEVVTPLPPLAGTVTLRWRLVGPDGHPVTDRVSFTITSPAATTPTTTLPADATTTGGPVTGAEVVPSTVAPPGPAATPDDEARDSELWSTPGFLRWFLRAISYVALMVAAGVVLTEHLVVHHGGWRSAAWLRASLATIAVAALLQLVVIASDIVARPWPRALDGLGAAAETDAGMAYVIRFVLALVAWLLVVDAPRRATEMRSTVLVLLALGLLGTWSFAGHSRSLRWPGVGVPLDVLHHGAAATWLGGLVIVGLVLLPRLSLEHATSVIDQFSTVATKAVIVIAATGVLQAVRLIGDPTDVFTTSHGTLLLLKIVVVAGMLALGDVNRRRVHAGLKSAGAAGNLRLAALRRGMLVEFATGLAIIGITAALVVATPAVAG